MLVCRSSTRSRMISLEGVWGQAGNWSLVESQQVARDSSYCSSPWPTLAQTSCCSDLALFLSPPTSSL